MTRHSTAAIWPIAEAKWAEICAHSPDLAPAVALQRRLLGLIGQAADAMTVVPLPTPLTPLTPLTDEAVAAKWRAGIPALRGETIAIPRELTPFVAPVCDALAEGGAGESALHIRDAIASGSLDAGSLLSVSLARNRKALRSSALHMGFAPDLLWLVGELASSPLAYHMQSALRRPFPDEWDQGYCPACGSWPALIEAGRGGETLRCSYCAAGWALSTRRCVYCRHDGGEFVPAAIDPDRPARRVDLCAACGHYTKVIEADAPAPFPLLAIDDLATLDLDRAAMDREYRRPELIDLDAQVPPRC